MKFRKLTYSNALVNIGNVLVEKERPVWAMRYFNEAIKIYPDNVGAWFDKADLLGRLGRHEEVLKTYDKMSENLSWFKSEAIVAKAYHLELIMNKPEEALKCFKKALELSKKDEFSIKEIKENIKRLSQKIK